jgi:hypothetical protein
MEARTLFEIHLNFETLEGKVTVVSDGTVARDQSADTADIAEHPELCRSRKMRF